MKIGDKFLSNKGEPMTLDEIEPFPGPKDARGKKSFIVRFSLDKERHLPDALRFVIAFQIYAFDPAVIPGEEFQKHIDKPRKTIDIPEGHCSYAAINRILHPTAIQCKCPGCLMPRP